MVLSSTQKGAIGENLLINTILKASDGRLSPFRPVADDDGIDVLFFDKLTGRSIAIQLKCRTSTLYKPGTTVRGNTAHFEVRKSTYNDARQAYLIAALLDETMTQFTATWFMPLSLLPSLAREGSTKWVIRPSISKQCKDRFVEFRHINTHNLAEVIIKICSR